jgi:hypothetical protein
MGGVLRENCRAATVAEAMKRSAPWRLLLTARFDLICLVQVMIEVMAVQATGAGQRERRSGPTWIARRLARNPNLNQTCRAAVQRGFILDAKELGALTTIAGFEYGQVPARVIRDVLLASDLEADLRGFRISNAYIDGPLNLDHAVLKFPVTFAHCYFEQRPSFNDTALPGLNISEGTFVPGLNLRRAVIQSDVSLSGLRSAGSIDAAGLRAGSVDMSGADLQGGGACLILNAAILSGRLSLRDAKSVGAISATAISTDELDFSNAILSNAKGEVLNLTRAHIKGSASLSGLRAIGAVSAFGAQIGKLDLAGVRLQVESGTALELSQAVIEGTAFCYGATVIGALNAADSSFGELVLTRARLKAKETGGRTLNAARVRVTGNFELSGLRSSGTIFMFGSQLGRLHMRMARIKAKDGTAMEMSRVEVKGTVDGTGMLLEGSLHAADAQFAQLNLQDAVFKRKNGTAANFARVKVVGKTTLAGIRAAGQVTAQNAEFGGVINFDGAHFKNMQLEALRIDGAQVGGAITFRNAVVIGKVSATGLRCRSVDMTLMSIQGPNGQMSIDLSRAEVTDFIVVQHAVFKGTFRAVGAKISQLEFRATALHANNGEGSLSAAAAKEGAYLSAPGLSLEAVSPQGVALHLDQSVISGDLVLDQVHALGEVRAIGATFGGKLILTGGSSLRKSSSAGDKSHALGLDLATIRALILENFTAEGGLNLRASRIEALIVNEVDPGIRPPALSSAQGWDVGLVNGYFHTNRKQVQGWLDTMSPTSARSVKTWWSGQEFVSQPWKEMAGVFERSGQPAAARRLRYAAARRATRYAPARSKPVRWLYAAFAGYGYYPLIVAAWLSLIGIAVYFLATSNASDFTQTTTGTVVVSASVTGVSAQQPSSCSQLQPVLFALETAIPAADTGQARSCRITGNAWLPIVIGSLKAFSWLLIGLLAAGMTGLLRKD